MALNKLIILDNGITTTYHRISTVNLDLYEKIVRVSESSDTFNEETGETIHTDPVYETVKSALLKVKLLSYVNKDYRDNSSTKNASSKDFYFEITPEESNSNLRELAYDKLKLIEEFKDAEDC